jgi:HK97 family phage prohead protease
VHENVSFRRAVIDGQERLEVSLEDVEIRDSGAGQDFYTLRGHAAVFNSLSNDLGGFKEMLAPGSMVDAIKNSRVHLLFNHDANYPLASTDSGTLELREDDLGLHVWARIPKELSYAKDLRVLMQAGIARDMSFAFSLPADGTGESWTRSADGENLRTITQVGELYDVSAVVRGAYSAPGYDLRSVLDRAVQDGRLPEMEGASPVAQDEPAGETTAANEEVGTDVQRAEALAASSEERQRKLKLARARTR